MLSLNLIAVFIGHVLPSQKTISRVLLLLLSQCFANPSVHFRFIQKKRKCTNENMLEAMLVEHNNEAISCFFVSMIFNKGAYSTLVNLP